MRLAVITWPTLDDDYAIHVITEDSKTDDQLAKMATRWAVMSLSEEAYQACTIALFTADLTNPKIVKNMDTEN